MNTWAVYVSKIVVVSLLGSVIIKYIAPWLQLAPSSTAAWLGVVVLPIGMGLALALRKS